MPTSCRAHLSLDKLIISQGSTATHLDRRFPCHMNLAKNCFSSSQHCCFIPSCSFWSQPKISEALGCTRSKWTWYENDALVIHYLEIQVKRGTQCKVAIKSLLAFNSTWVPMCICSSNNCTAPLRIMLPGPDNALGNRQPGQAWQHPNPDTAQETEGRTWISGHVWSQCKSSLRHETQWVTLTGHDYSA